MATTTHDYLFDAKFFGSIRVQAETPEQAAAKLRAAVAGATVNAGCWPESGDPILFTADLDGALDLVEVDGEGPDAMGDNAF